MNESRRGYEFSARVKKDARKRANNQCEVQFGLYCTTDTNVDHITPVCLAKRMGIRPEIVRSRANAQIICSACDELKQVQEMLFKRMLEKGEMTFSPVRVEWAAMERYV